MSKPNWSIEREQDLFVAGFGKPASRETGLVLVNARIKAGEQRTSHIESPHLLWGLAVSSEVIPLLRLLGIKQPRLIELSEIFMKEQGSTNPDLDRKLSDRSMRTLELAKSHSDRFLIKSVEPLDVALGMADEGEGIAGGALAAMGADFQRMQKAVAQLRFKV